MPVLSRVRLHGSARRQQHGTVRRPADARLYNAGRRSPGFSGTQRAGAALGAILLLFAVSGGGLDFHYAGLTADFDPLPARNRLCSTGKGNLKNQHEDRTHSRQATEQSGAACGRYETGVRHLLQESLAAFAADTRANFSAVI
ncbi:hypothetical protein K3725_02525 [Leisingera sp. S132]|uniref:hypothetical protein n=1 Tax=Leisingera sp. S132 TaxID=2867016 RepID=UPI0021A61A88|nr:hypothetical protein [Leisingera sp. S132]UWQ79902.1 hypothetical protein K3725_02525 [Leisingera sp. S132]